MFTTLALTAALFSSPLSEEVLETDAPKIEVMVLGSYHFTGGGQDLHNANVDDHLAPQRQAEIQTVVDALAAFAPDKIMVELAPEYEADFNARYEAYRAGDDALGVNERDQLGMRLAAQLDHDRLYAIDHASDMDFEAMIGAAQTGEQTRLMGEFGNFNAAMPAVMADFETGTVSERLRKANSQAVLDSHTLYLTLAQMGSVEDPVGAREMGQWWTRNLVIFSNAAAHAEPGDRILIIYGSGHKALLEQFFEDALGFELVDPLQTLPQ